MAAFILEQGMRGVFWGRGRVGEMCFFPSNPFCGLVLSIWSEGEARNRQNSFFHEIPGKILGKKSWTAIQET